MKILVVRFSSIGDIVLTTPILRALKQQVDNAEIHYLTKKQFATILDGNPHIDKIHTIDKSIDEVLEVLRKEEYDHIIDLHNNIRTTSLKKKLNITSNTVRKLNWKKWLLVNFKMDRMPDLHIVDRYFEVVQPLGVSNDMLPGEFNISAGCEVNVLNTFGLHQKEYFCVSIGAQFNTKRMPKALLVSIIQQINTPIILIGGDTDVELANEVMSALDKNSVFNACGKYNLKESASIVMQGAKLLTNDTGMMHIASCLNVPIVSVWGNTVPSLGMYPYYPNQKEMYSIHEVSSLGCRPCSKIGYQKCPKGHFNCMQNQDVSAIVEALLK